MPKKQRNITNKDLDHKETLRYKDSSVDSFFIPKETIEAMNKLSHKTSETGREYGMALCLNKDKRVVSGNIETGDFVSVDVPETCKDYNDKFIGSFHTHPEPSETRFSAMDLFSSCDNKSKIDCVGMNKKGEIRCFVKKNLNKSCQEDAKPLVDIEDTYKYLDEDDVFIVKDALLKAVDNFTENKFKEKLILERD